MSAIIAFLVKSYRYNESYIFILNLKHLEHNHFTCSKNCKSMVLRNLNRTWFVVELSSMFMSVWHFKPCISFHYHFIRLTHIYLVLCFWFSEDRFLIQIHLLIRNICYKTWRYWSDYFVYRSYDIIRNYLIQWCWWTTNLAFQNIYWGIKSPIGK